MKAKLLLVLLLFGTLKMVGQVEFEKKVVIDKVHSAFLLTSTFSVDVDGDGDLDVLSSSKTDDLVVWYENTNGLGEFYAHLISNDLRDPSYVYAADVDGDGDMDVLSASNPNISIWTKKLVWYENLDGQGNFATERLIDTGVAGVSQIVTSDIDNDGDLDIIISASVDDIIAYYENDGLGNFGEQQFIDDYANNARGVELSDIDGDGDIDVVSASLGDKISWYQNNNGSGFSNAIMINNTSPPKIHLSDVDGDGDDDLIFSKTNSVVWQENFGSGSFGSEQVISNSLNNVRTIYAADIDLDSDLDLVMASYDDNKVVWFENLDGLGNFGSENIIDPEMYSPLSIHAKDIDGDGDLDILLGSVISLAVVWYENIDSQGAFSSRKRISKTAGQGVNSVIATDIDGDSDLDLVSTGLGYTGWYENLNGLGDFGTQQFITEKGPDNYITTFESFGSAIASGDIDGDGDNDLALVVTDAVNTWYGSIFWFENSDGQGSFDIEHIGSTNLGYVNSINLEDLDNDGDLDIAYTDGGGLGAARWLENLDGLGNFSNDLPIYLYDNGTSLNLVDIDSDGDKDVVSSHDEIRINDGSGTFSFGPNVVRDNGNSYTVVVKDLNNDNSLDLIYAEGWYSFNGNAYVLNQSLDIDTNNCQGAFLSGGDIDLDGDMDIVSCDNYNDKITWNQNLDGLGTFSAQENLDTDINSPKSVIIVDIDNDGDLDLVSISEYTVNWYKNTLDPNVNIIEGNVGFNIAGNNCDTNLVSNIMVVSQSNSQSVVTFTETNGDFRLYVGVGDYVTEIYNNFSQNFSSNPTSGNTTFSDYGNEESLDFCIEPINITNDLSISIYPAFNQPRPGFDTTYRLVYKNLGATSLSGIISFEFEDASIQFINASEPTASQTASSLTFNFSELNPFAIRVIDLNFNVFSPPLTNIGDELVSTAMISPITGDETEDDNTFVLNQTVIGSYDPNDIMCLEGDEVLIEDADKYLHYLIRFQNTGTASAINVRVEHTLDDKLDWTTMQLENLSHTGRVTIENGSDVEFLFNNINLPDSTSDEPNSHGFIAFKIKPMDDVVVGDAVDAVADIYFDFNPPIVTNTASTEFVETLSVADFDTEQFTVYPNPTSRDLHIKSTLFFNGISLTDINGRVLKTMTFNTAVLNYELKLDDLNGGIYFMTIITEKGHVNKKIIKR